MKLHGEYTFDGPREEVWKLLRDLDTLVLALPGTKSLKQVGENQYEGELQVRIGPIAGSFDGKLTISNEKLHENLTLAVDGNGKIGFVKGSGDVVFVEQGTAKTTIKYSGEIQIGGRVASVGQRLFDTVSKSMIDQGLNKLNEILKERVAAPK
jgi:carbon monoxide dehydrogenase subunit G